LIAEKWNFPTDLVAAIRYHHDPLSAPKECRTLVFAVYLANMICEIEKGNVIFEQIEPAVLASFSLTAKKQIDTIVQRLSSAFKH